MKKCTLISFTARGGELAGRIALSLFPDWEVSSLQPVGRLGEVMGGLFENSDAIVFVCACGIAVRAIAPYVVSKTTDPAVVVVDERGRHVISLLSGHIGGANELTLRIASAIDADPVITTATDVNGRFSVDAWAAKQDLQIDSMETAKLFSSEILKRDLPFFTDIPFEGELPEGLFSDWEGDLGAAVTYRMETPFERTLRLIPRCLHLGIGCRRDTPAESIREHVLGTLREHGFDPKAVKQIASIDVKAQEAGLLAFAQELGVPAVFYPAEHLMQAEGTFSASDFVLNTVGVDNVCERAAVLSAGEGAQLVIPKTAAGGVTVAAALENRRIRFE